MVRIFATTLLILVLAKSTSADAVACRENDEQRRLVAHFDRVLSVLLSRDTSGLTDRQRANRQRQIQTLASYRDRGDFPRNLDFPDKPMPYFVDDRGTHCAVGYLLHRDGRNDVVENIRRIRNNAYVYQLVDEPGLSDWLRLNGLTVDEAALIQPQYYWMHRPADAICGGSNRYGGPTGYAFEAKVVGIVSGTVSLALTKIFGDSKRLLSELARRRLVTTQPYRPNLSALRPRLRIGDRVYANHLVAVSRDVASVPRTVKIRKDGTVGYPEHTACTSARRFRLPARMARKLMLSADCERRLARIDSGWTDIHCRGGVGLDPKIIARERQRRAEMEQRWRLIDAAKQMEMEANTPVVETAPHPTKLPRPVTRAGAPAAAAKPSGALGFPWWTWIVGTSLALLGVLSIVIVLVRREPRGFDPPIV